MSDFKPTADQAACASRLASMMSWQVQRWAAFCIGMLFFLYAFIQRVAPSVMTEELMRDLRVGATSLGILSGAYFYAYAVIQLPIGLLIDRFGPRRLMSGAALLGCLASLGFANSETLVVATLFRALIGVAVAFAFVGTLSILSNDFPPQRFDLLAGLLQSMGMAGALAGQAPLRWMIETWGWSRVFEGLAMLAGLLAGALYLLVPRRKKRDSPAPSVIAGQSDDALAVATENPTTTDILNRDNPTLIHSLRRVTRNPQSWFCALFGFGMAAPMLAFAGLWGIPWLKVGYGLNPAEAAALIAWVFIGWAAGAPAAGIISNYQGRRKPVMVAGALLSLISLTAVIYVPDLPHHSLRMLMFALGSGGGTMIILFSSVKEVNNLHDKAAAMGFANTFVVGSGGVMQVLLGWLLDITAASDTTVEKAPFAVENYRTAFVLLLVTAIMALFAATRIRDTGSGKAGTR